jgi:segregation and condensation protein B
MADNQNENNNYEQIIEAILFAAGRVVTEQELMIALEISQEKIENIINKMQIRYEKSGIQIIKVEKGYQMCSNPKYYEYIYPIIDKRTKPNLSNAALETLAIIAYNPRATRPEIEAIRGVNSDGTIYKLLEYGLIEEAGKADLPGRPTTYKTTQEFLKMFGYSSLNDLPELPKYKLDSNNQIVIDELLDEEAPMPSEREEVKENQK